MKYDFRLILSEYLLHPFTVTNIGTDICLDFLTNAGKHKVITLGERFLRNTGNFGAKLMQPDGKPASLETGMTSDKHTLPMIEGIKNVYHE